MFQTRSRPLSENKLFLTIANGSEILGERLLDDRNAPTSFGTHDDGSLWECHSLHVQHWRSLNDEFVEQARDLDVDQ